MTARVLVDGLAESRVSALDRGLAYGDGLFETIRAVNGTAPLWHRHMTRLRDGCERLDLPVSDAVTLAKEFARVAGGIADAVVKIILTRGHGERGYALPEPVPSPVSLPRFHYRHCRRIGTATESGYAVANCGLQRNRGWPASST